MHMVLFLVLLVRLRQCAANKLSINSNGNVPILCHCHAKSQSFTRFVRQNLGQTISRPWSLVVCKQKSVTRHVLVYHKAKRNNILQINSKYLTDTIRQEPRNDLE